MLGLKRRAKPRAATTVKRTRKVAVSVVGRVKAGMVSASMRVCGGKGGSEKDIGSKSKAWGDDYI